MGLGVLPLAKRDQITPQVSEYFALLLLATLGMGFVVTSRNLLGAFVALELVSLSLYAMTVLNQAKPRLRRGSAEISDVRRGGVRLSAVRAELPLRCH